MASPGPGFPSGWRVPRREAADAFVDRLVDDHSAAFQAWSDRVLYLLGVVERGLLAVPWWLVALVVALLVWHATRRPLAGALTAAGLVVVGAFGLWPETVTTLALMALATARCVLVGVPLGVLMSRSAAVKAVLRPVLDLLQTLRGVVYLVPVATFGLWPETVKSLALMALATALCVFVGVPLGVLMSRSAAVTAVLRPVLDLMQTLPSFVYLVPVVMFFGLGNVSALFATFVYAV